MLTLSSCLSSKTVIRNYNFFNRESCDCITKHPLILIGTTSNYFSKEKAICTRLNYIARRDSIRLLQDLKYRLEEEDINGDSLTGKVIRIDSIVNELKDDWTHLKIKTKWKGSVDSLDATILKQKIKYFNKFKPLRKYIGIEKYKNGVLIKSKMKNGYNTK